jgi:histidine phosphotransferase ChpT
VIRAEGPRLLLDPNLRATLERGAAGTVEARAAGAWLAHALIQEAGGKLQLSPADSPVLMIGAAF